jgi:uncharacterized Zn-binding protein involved in type VI secretion
MSTLLDAGASAICPHGGQVSIVSTNTRVTAGGQPVAVMADTFLVAGCVFMVGTKPQPCTKVQWLVPASRVTIGGQPAVLQSSSGLCLSADQIPAGPPNVLVTQVRVQGT